jgi:hypothetical protein
VTASGAAVPGRPLADVMRLARLLIGLRFRSWRGMLKAGPKVAAARLAALFAVVVPLAYVGLLVTAFSELGAVGGRETEEAALALVCGVVALCSLCSKVASGDLVVGRGGEIELLLAHPVSMPALVVARGLAGVCTDLFGALFLLPVLAAAAVVWRLPVVALPLAAITSVLVQIGITALAQAAQIAVVGVVPARSRRPVFVLAALLAAAGMAGIWMSGSAVLRAPDRAVAALASWRRGLLAGPGGWITAPLRALDDVDLARHGLGPALAALAALAAGTAAALWLSAQVVRAAVAQGWEQAGPLGSEERRRGRPGAGTVGVDLAAIPLLGLPGKDWRQLLRDRTRLVTLLALPTLFIGAQVFGSAGWGFSTASSTRLAICAFSLAAYAATFGPLVHLEAERRAFWILRAVPVSLARLFAQKAVFWSAVLGGYAAVMYGALGILARFRWDGDFISGWIWATLGAVIVAWLAVGLGAAEADLSDDQRSALGPGTAYLFMIVSGLFNLVILAEGTDQLRALALFTVATTIAFVAGVTGARDVFDPDVLRSRRLSPVTGALGMVLLFLGARAARLVGPGLGDRAGLIIDAAWIVVIAGFAGWHWLRQEGAGAQARSALGAAAQIGAAAAAFVATLVLQPQWRASTLHLVHAALEELLARGIVQVALTTLAAATLGSRRLLGRTLALLASIALVMAVAPATPVGIAGAILPAVALALTGRWWTALSLRLLIEALAFAGF